MRHACTWCVFWEREGRGGGDLANVFWAAAALSGILNLQRKLEEPRLCRALSPRNELSATCWVGPSTPALPGSEGAAFFLLERRLGAYLVG